MHDATFVVSLPFDRLRVSGRETASITTERYHLTPSENEKQIILSLRYVIPAKAEIQENNEIESSLPAVGES